MTRKEFIASLGAATCATGCQSLFEGKSFYGPTIRDRLWMWGHHKEMCHKSFPPKHPTKKWVGPSVEQVEGCRLMGIPNDCVVRWGNMPRYPWGNYFEQFRAMKRFTFSITDGAKESVREKMRIAFEEIQPNFPNFTGCFLDDYFRPANLGQGSIDISEIADQVHAHNLRLSVVLYSDSDGLKPEFKRKLACCDETSFWFWHSKNIHTMGDTVRKCRDFIGPEKSLLMGMYMWDYTLGEPVPADRMEMQLNFARQFLKEGLITGLIFHPTYSAALDVPSVNLAKQWIKAYGDDLWGV